jgi:NAD(P)-dependent dehydrogenase (short-subunit alcohol dehydrogenase family)
MQPSNTSMQGKTCMITGATAGIGEVTAQALAQMSAKVILVGRSQGKCVDTVSRIKEKTGTSSVEYLLADLTSQAQIRTLAGEFQKQHDRLDVLVNNAGGAFVWRQESVDGIEMTFALNHLNYFLLTNLLLDTIKASAPARIVNVSSNSHYGASINFDDLEGKRKYWWNTAYGQSKLANVLFTYELARRLEGTSVTTNALHPGFVATEIGRNNGALVRLLLWIVHHKALTPQEGARTNIYLASSPEVSDVTGKYYDKERQVKSDPASYDLDTARRLWEVSAEMVGI